MYIRFAALEQLGEFDERYPMGFEDVDYCLRAWEAGYEVVYEPAARLHHHESATRGSVQGERELASQRAFWDRWATFFGPRPVRGPDGRLRIIYVTEDATLGGGHRVVFEHLNGLLDRGHDAQLWTLGPAPEWFDLHCPVRTFADYGQLAARTGAAGRDQGCDLVEDRDAGMAVECRARRRGLLRAGHRDQLLPGCPERP